MQFEFKFPDVGEGIHEGKIVKWIVKEGDLVKADDSLAEVETDKAIVEIPSPRAGKISKITHKEGDTIKVGEVLAVIETLGITDASKKASEKPKGSTGVVGSLEETAQGVLKAPSLEQSGAIFSKGVKPSISKSVPGHTPKPKQESVRARESEQKPGTTNVIKSDFKAVKKYDMFGYVDRIPYDGVRKAVGDQMIKSAFTIPHVTQTDLADVTELFNLRQKEKVKAEKKGIKLTFLPYFIKAVIEGLKRHPALNSSLDEDSRQIILKKYYNIGIAVDLEGGLMVPVIKGADQKSLYDIAKEIETLAEKARTRKLNPMDMKGGTFTITNVGSAGSGWFATPIINHPEAAILATGMIQSAPAVYESISAKNMTDSAPKIAVRKLLPLSLTYDHRILDGLTAALFLKTIKEILEDTGKIK